MNYGTNTENIAGFEYGKNAGIHAPTCIYNVSMTYDANGNLISDGNFTYTYDNANHLKKVTRLSNNQTVADFAYDEYGNRVKKYEGGVATLYISDEYEYDFIQGGVSTVYYFANGNRVAKESAGEKFWYLDDHLGSTNVMIDENGSLVERTLYYPFGSYRSGEASEKYAFTGKEFDSDIGLYYYGARYYNPETFVFTQADSMIPDVYNPQALNRYAYCLNNPVKYEDPDGHYVVVPMALCAGTLFVFILGGSYEYHRQINSEGYMYSLPDVIGEACHGGAISGIAAGAGAAVMCISMGVGVGATDVELSAALLNAGVSGTLERAALGSVISTNLGVTIGMADRAVTVGINENTLSHVFNGEYIVSDWALNAIGSTAGSSVSSTSLSEALSQETQFLARISIDPVLNLAADHANNDPDSDDYSFHLTKHVTINVPKNSAVGKEIGKRMNK